MSAYLTSIMCMHAGTPHCRHFSIDPCLPSPLVFWVLEPLGGEVSNQLARNQMYYINDRGKLCAEATRVP